MRFERYLDEIFAKGSHVRLLRLLVSSPGKAWSERELATAAEVDHKVVNYVMPLFLSYKLVDKQRLAKANVYRLNLEHYIIKQLRRLFIEERAVREHLKQKLAQACARNKHIISVILFGSVANGTEELDSDIDLLTIVDQDVELSGMFKKVEAEFGHAVVLHLWTIDQLREKANTALFRKALKIGQHIYGKRLEELVR